MEPPGRFQTPGPPDSHQWRRRSTRLLLDRLPWLRVFADDVELPDGRQVDGFLRIESRPYAMAFAVTDNGEVPFIWEYKYGLDATDLRLPAGYLEADEAPEACARRELLEETGYEAATWDSLGSYVTDSNRGYSRGHFFLARQARRVRPPNAGDLAEVRVELRPLDTIERLLSSGQLQELGPVACVALALARLRATTAE